MSENSKPSRLSSCNVLQIFLSTRWTILLNLQQEIFRVNGYALTPLPVHLAVNVLVKALYSLNIAACLRFKLYHLTADEYLNTIPFIRD